MVRKLLQSELLQLMFILNLFSGVTLNIIQSGVILTELYSYFYTHKRFKSCNLFKTLTAVEADTIICIFVTSFIILPDEYYLQ